MALPANVSTCRIDMRLIQAVVDGADADRAPDGVVLTDAKVTFTASIPFCRNATAVPPTLIVIAPITCGFDANGSMIGPDSAAGIEVVASNDPDLNPTGWTYSAKITHPAIPAITTTFAAPSGGTIDLAAIVTVPASPGVALIDWQVAVTAAQSASAAAANSAGIAVTKAGEATAAAAASEAARAAALAETTAALAAQNASLSSTYDTKANTASTYARVDQRAIPFVGQYLSYAKGGVVGTAGKAALALRFDDWQDNIISLGIMAQLKARYLFGSIALCSQLGANNWNKIVTWDNLRDWNRNYGMEIWSHGTNHVTPDGATGTDGYAGLVREIITSKAQIEAQNMRVMGWSMPGVAAPGYGTGMNTGDWNTDAGRLLMATYGLVETDMSGTYRTLPSDLRYGLAHATVSDGMTLAEAELIVDATILGNCGLELMTHAGNLGTAGCMTFADWLLLLDYIVTKRDAGLLEIVTPSSLAFCDPSRSRRLDLNSNGTFAITSPASGWTNVGGNNTIISIPDGPPTPVSGTTNVLRLTGGTFSQQQIGMCQRRGIAGQTFVFDVWVRAETNGAETTSSFRLTAQDNDPLKLGINLFMIPAPATWTHVRRVFTVPPNVDSFTIGIARGTTVGSDRVQVANFHCYVA